MTTPVISAYDDSGGEKEAPPNCTNLGWATPSLFGQLTTHNKYKDIRSTPNLGHKFQKKFTLLARFEKKDPITSWGFLTNEIFIRTRQKDIQGGSVGTSDYLFYFKICTAQGRGGEKGKNANFKKKAHGTFDPRNTLRALLSALLRN